MQRSAMDSSFQALCSSAQPKTRLFSKRRSAHKKTDEAGNSMLSQSIRRGLILFDNHSPAENDPHRHLSNQRRKPPVSQKTSNARTNLSNLGTYIFTELLYRFAAHLSSACGRFRAASTNFLFAKTFFVHLLRSPPRASCRRRKKHPGVRRRAGCANAARNEFVPGGTDHQLCRRPLTK